MRAKKLTNHAEFCQFLDDLPSVDGRQLRQILPHLLFPDRYERISSPRHKREILEGFGLATRKDAKKMSIAALDSAIYHLRRKLERELGREIDFYEKEIESQWRETGTTYLVSWKIPSAGTGKHSKRIEIQQPLVARLFSVGGQAPRNLERGPFDLNGYRDSQSLAGLIPCFRGNHRGEVMGKPLSMDLRARALAAVDGGISRRAAAGRFGVSMSSVIRWDAARRETGSFAPKPQGGDTRSRRIEAQRAAVMAAFEAERDQSLEELRARLAGLGVTASTSALSRFFQRHGLTRKKRPATRSSRIGGHYRGSYPCAAMGPNHTGSDKSAVARASYLRAAPAWGSTSADQCRGYSWPCALVRDECLVRAIRCQTGHPCSGRKRPPRRSARRAP